MSNTLSSTEDSPRVLFLGMQGNFSYPPLYALLKQGIQVCAVVIPTEPIPGYNPKPIRRREEPRTVRPTLPLLPANGHASIVQLAWERKIPVWEVQSLRDSETVTTLAAYHPDIICVACFSQRIPQTILDLPRLGCLNVHPSLLPANRGPDPIFWVFREGLAQTGITIHCMDEGLDTGDILAQECIGVSDGMTYAELEHQCATSGGVLLAQAIWQLYQGQAIRIPQNESQSSYHPHPRNEDLIIDAETWNARHIYNFIRGVNNLVGPVTIHTPGNDYLIQDVISYSHETTDISNNDLVLNMANNSDGELLIRCKDGQVKIRV